MLRRTFFAAVALAAMTVSSWAASPAGTFNVAGTNPGSGTQYRGTVSVTATGSTFRVVWTVAGQRSEGTGLWVDEKFVVGYQGNSVACYTEQSDGTWSGHWANGESTQVGTERWSR